jgi:hypothetical protein
MLPTSFAGNTRLVGSGKAGRTALLLASHLLTATRRADLPRGEFPIQGVG